MCPARHLVLLAPLVVQLSCYEERAFLCETDFQCNLEALSGECQETGYCAYPDFGCKNPELRYEPFAGDGFAGECVGEEAD